MTRRSNRLLMNFSLFAAALITAFVPLEAGFRFLAYRSDLKLFSEAMKKKVEIPENGEVELGSIVYPSENHRIAYYLKQNISINFKGVPVHTNSDGFREGEYPIEKDDNTVRIIGIGDSVMFGFGVEEGKDYLSRIEERLNKYSSEKNFEVINMAVPGYNTVAEVELLKEKGLKYKPDIVILGFLPNDLELAEFMRKKEDYFTLKKSFWAEWVKNRLTNSQRSPFQSKPPVKYALDISKIPEEYRDCVGVIPCINALEELKALSIEHDFEVIVFMFISPNWSADNLVKDITDVSLSLGFHVINVEGVFRDYVKTFGNRIDMLYVSATDNHPSAFSHGVAAEMLMEYIIKNRSRLKF